MPWVTEGVLGSIENLDVGAYRARATGMLEVPFREVHRA